MGLVARLADWLSSRAERRRRVRAAEKLDDPRCAAEAIRYLIGHPDALEVTVETGHGKALFTRADVPRLKEVAREHASIGERVFAHTMRGGGLYGSPTTWSSDRIEQVQHLKTWVFVAVRRIWDRIACKPPRLGWVTEGPGPGTRTKAMLAEWRRVKSLNQIQPHEQVMPCPAGHPLARLLHNPNRPDVSFDLWSELGLFLELTGNAYLWAVPSRLGVLDGTFKAAELWVIPSHWVWPRVGKDRLIEWYEIRPWIGPGVLRFPPEDVIHLRYKSPIHKIDGFSHLTAGAEWIDTQESVNRARFYQFKNGCYVTGNLKLGGDRYVDLDDEDLDRLYAKFFGRFQGEHRAGLPIITPPDAEYVPLVINPTEMAYVQSADQLRDTILSLWAVPKEVAGIQDAGSEIAVYGPLRQFAENALTPRVTYLGQALTEQLARRWDRTLRLWWEDMAEESPEEKRERLLMRYRTQSITTNELRAEYGDPPVVGGDDVPKPSVGRGGFGGAGDGGQPDFLRTHAGTNGNGRRH